MRSSSRFRKTAQNVSGPKSKSPKLKSQTKKSGSKISVLIKPSLNVPAMAHTEKMWAMPAQSMAIPIFTTLMVTHRMEPIRNLESWLVIILNRTSIPTPLFPVISSSPKKKSDSTIQMFSKLILTTLGTIPEPPSWSKTYQTSTPFKISQTKSIKTSLTITISFTFPATSRYPFF